MVYIWPNLAYIKKLKMFDCVITWYIVPIHESNHVASNSDDLKQNTQTMF